MKAVLVGKGLGLGQCLACDGGHMGFGTVHADIIGEVRQIIGRRITQGRFGGFTACVVRQAHRVNGEVFDLAGGDDQLAAHAARFETGGSFAQNCQLTREIVGGDRNLTDLTPAACGAVQQFDALGGQRKSKIRLHALPLLRFD